MSIHATCPRCREAFQRPDGLADKLEKCPQCTLVFRMPCLPGTVPAEHAESERPPSPEDSPKKGRRQRPRIVASDGASALRESNPLLCYFFDVVHALWTFLRFLLRWSP
jgi:hypothetical protein